MIASEPMTTISDIAKKAGVSGITVSRVLNGADYLRPTFQKRAEKIRRIAKELDYRPNMSARAMREGKFRAITLLMCSNRQLCHHSLKMIYGVQAAAEAAGMTVSLATVSVEQLNDGSYVPQALAEHRSDGLLLNYDRPPARLHDMISRFSVPTIFLNIDEAYDCVRPDDFGVGRAATRRLIDQGHKRIWYLGNTTTPEIPHYSQLHRRDGYLAEMKAAGLTQHGSDRQRNRDWTPTRDIAAWASKLAKPDRPTACIVYSNSEAVRIAIAANLAGLALGRDLSLTTFSEDHHVVDGLFDMWLVPDFQMGQVGFEMLQEKIESPDVPLPSRIIPFTLLAGNSAASPSNT